MLRACRRLLRPEGRTAFLTIFTAPGLSTRDHRRAVRMGPRAVRSDRQPEELLRAAGFIDIQVTDLTREFLETARRWYAGNAEREQELRRIVGGPSFDQQQADRKRMIAAIEEGLLLRALCVAAKPVRV